MVKDRKKPNNIIENSTKLEKVKNREQRLAKALRENLRRRKEQKLKS